MKIRIISILFAIALLLTACGSGSVSQAGENAESRVENAVDTVETMLKDAVTPDSDRISKEDAQKIALEHAGFTEDQVQYLRVEFEIDDGVEQYDVEFHNGGWEYSYDIDAKTGNILSFEKDD